MQSKRMTDDIFSKEFDDAIVAAGNAARRRTGLLH